MCHPPSTLNFSRYYTCISSHVFAVGPIPGKVGWLEHNNLNLGTSTTSLLQLLHDMEITEIRGGYRPKEICLRNEVERLLAQVSLKDEIGYRESRRLASLCPKSPR